MRGRAGARPPQNPSRVRGDSTTWGNSAAGLRGLRATFTGSCDGDRGAGRRSASAVGPGGGTRFVANSPDGAGGAGTDWTRRADAAAAPEGSANPASEARRPGAGA